MDTIATLVSMCLQSGMPLKTLVRKFKDMSFAPAGFTNNSDIPTAKSITDYVFRYLGTRFMTREDREELFGPSHEEPAAAPIIELANLQSNRAAEVVDAPQPELAMAPAVRPVVTNSDAPVCQCGTLMVRAGACYACPNCFATTGVCN
jgi:ribonucleoside-diphosphate reductase alpha chain